MKNTDNIPPYFLVRALGKLRGFLLSLHGMLFPGTVVLYEKFQSFWIMQPLYIAAELNIAEHLLKKPMSAEELASRTNTQPDALYRVLRALASEGIFKETEGKKFGLNSRARALLTGKGSIRHVIIHHLGNTNWTAMGGLAGAVRTGRNAFTQTFGTDIYPYLRQNGDEMQRFEKSMSDLAELALNPLISRYDFAKYKSIADIGGGVGSLLGNILLKYPQATGLLFDLPENSAGAENYIKSEKLEGRMRFFPGSFLEPFNLRADIYILKNVLHNWDNEHCARILANLCRTIPEGAKVLVLEMVVPKPGISSYAKMVDIQMLASMPGGRERTKQEFEALLKTSGLKLKKVIPTIAPLSILEAVRE